MLISEIGFQAHYEDFGRGVIDTKHVVYFPQRNRSISFPGDQGAGIPEMEIE